MKLKITLLLLTLCAGLLSAQTVNIGATSYPTITAAITAASAGDVILITGTHTESISIDKSITLRGANPATDIIQADALPATATTRVVTITGIPPTALTVSIENLGIRNGNITGANGGGIFVDKNIGLTTLKNLIIEGNKTTTNGGGIGCAGSNVNIIECTLTNNTAGAAGGGIIATPNNASGVDNIVNINQSLINANTAVNGGGIYLFGNAGFGNSYKIALNIENSTISNNSATSVSGGNGGGGILSISAPLLPASVIGNVTLRLIHTTTYNNTHISSTKAGIQFLPAATTTPTNFSAYNSIIVGNDDLTAAGPKAINFTNSNITSVVNCIFGGTTLPPTIVSDMVPNANNNEAGKSATYAGLATTLSNEGGPTQVIKLNAATKGVDYCTVATGVSIPTSDQRGYTRPATYDAGAYELAGTLSIRDKNLENVSINVYPNPTKGFVTISGLNTVDVVRVYSLLGSLEKEIHNQNEFDVSNLSSGVHIMMIEGDGQKIVKRIIIE
jgi:Secretion system C-terminal sorting domain